MADFTSTSQECAICQQPIGLPRDDGSIEDMITTPCGHSFGEICLQTWLDSATSCPYCRTELITVQFYTMRCPGHTIYDVAETFVEMLFADIPPNATRTQLAATVHLTVVRFINTIMHLNGLPDSAPELTSLGGFDAWISEISAYLATYSPLVSGVEVEVEGGVERILDFARSLSPMDNGSQDIRDLMRDLLAAEDGDHFDSEGVVPNMEALRLRLLGVIALERVIENREARERSAANDDDVERSEDDEDEETDHARDESPGHMVVEEAGEAESEKFDE